MSDDAGGRAASSSRARTSPRSRRERTIIIRWPGRALLATAVGVTAAVVVLPTAALADAGTWGPDATPYRNGVVCDTGAGDTALVSWAGTGGNPTFGLSPIQSGSGNTDEPATSGVALPVQASSGGLDSTTIAQLAYLVSAHGDDGSAGVVGDVAADVLQLAGTATSSVERCLGSGIDGAAPAEAADLLDEARRLAGPYSVSLSGPSAATPAGQPIPLTARVTSAAGDPVPGLAVGFSPSSAATQLSSRSAITHANGEAQVVARAVSGASSTAVTGAAVTATVQVPVGLSETSAGGDVAVVGAATPQHYADSVALDVDTRPHPQVQLGTDRSLLLTGERLAQTLEVTGMNGHLGSTTVSLYGPLTLTRSGCSAHTASDWAAARAAHTVAESSQVSVTGDGSYPVGGSAALAPGCYRATAQLQTTDASPNVTARATGDVVTVAPVTVSATPEHGGLAPVGSLHTVLHATSTLATSWQDVQGEVVGPRPATDGRCPTTGWDSTSSAALVPADASTSSDSDPQTATGATASADPPSTGAPTTSSTDPSDPAAGATDTAVTVASDAVAAAGCYAFRLTATLRLPGIGSTTLSLAPGAGDTPVHVIAPAVSVTGLSTSGVDSGGHLAATVEVTSSDGQPGSLHLELLRLPYTYRGCFGADWSRAAVVRTPRTPVLTTRGDNTYRVSTAAVPGSACWTVVPVFTASANPAVRAQAAAGDDPMLAFTSTVRPHSARVNSAAPEVGSSTSQEVAVGLAVAALLSVLLLATLAAARAGRRSAAIAPRDRLLGPSAG